MKNSQKKSIHAFFENLILESKIENLKGLFFIYSVLFVSILFSFLYINLNKLSADIPDEYFQIHNYGQALLYTNAYLFFCVMCFTLCVVFRFFDGFKTDWLVRKVTVHKSKIVIALACAIFAITISEIDVNFVFAVILFGLCAYAYDKKLNNYAIIPVLVVLLAAPLFVGLKIPDYYLWGFDSHWTAVFGQGRFGLLNEIESLPVYGLILNSIFSISSKITISDSTNILQGSSILFSMLIFVVLLQRMQGEPKYIVLLGLTLTTLIFVQAISPITANIVYPNLLPIRFITIPMIVVLSYYLYALNLNIAWSVSGLLGACLILYNFETGVYCILGLGYALFLKSLQNNRVMLLAKFFVIYSLSFVFGLMGLREVFFPDAGFLLVGNIVESALNAGGTPFSGVAGQAFYLHAPFLFVYSHVFIWFCRFLSDKNACPRNPLQFQSAVIVGIIVAMGFYPLYHFHIWNMWVIILLYVLFVLTNLRESKPRKSLLWIFAITIIVAPFQFQNPALYIKIASKYWTHDTHTDCVPSFKVSQKLCDQLKTKAQELEAFADPTTLHISSLNTTLAEMTGIQPVLPRPDYFFFASNNAKFNLLAEQIRTSDYRRLLLDKLKPDNPYGSPTLIADFYVRLANVSGFQITSETEHWLIAERVN